MGGSTSRFAETDWDQADGCLKDASETLEGVEPLKRHQILTITRNSLVNPRDFDIKDDKGDLLYTTKAVPGTVKSFELLGKNNEKLFRVNTDPSHVNWDFLSYGKQAFYGQQPDEEVSKSVGEKLYRKVRVHVSWDKYHGEVLKFVPDPTDLAGIVQSSNPVSGPGILKVDQITSITPQYQSYVPKAAPLDLPHPPLVGFWVWENTENLHQMKMHLAKGSDAALHIMLAILTNLVTIERNAVKD